MNNEEMTLNAEKEYIDISLKKPLVYSFCKSLLDKKVKLQIIPCRVLQGLSKKKDWLHARFDTVRWLMKQIETKLSGQPS